MSDSAERREAAWAMLHQAQLDPGGDPYPELCIYPDCVGQPAEQGCPCVTGEKAET